MIGAILVGLGVLATGFGLQRFFVRKLAKEHREVKERFGNYFNSDIVSSEELIVGFIESNYPAFPMSGKSVLWTLSDDYGPCIVAYDKSHMMACKVELRDGEIFCRDSQAVIIDFLGQSVDTVWLLRQSEEKPVFEMDILYSKDGIKKELKILRFGVDVDGGMNYHKFRSFINSLKIICKENNIGFRDLIR